MPDYTWTPWERKKWRVLVWLDGQLVSHVGMLERVVSVGEQQVKVGGIYTVMTATEWRGRGFAGEAMKAAAAFMDAELAVEFGFLLCPDRMVPFYSGLGWRRLSAAIAFDQPSGKVTSLLNGMALPCRRREWPAGTVHLCGLPW